MKAMVTFIVAFIKVVTLIKVESSRGPPGSGGRALKKNLTAAAEFNIQIFKSGAQKNSMHQAGNFSLPKQTLPCYI
jgi:hypothetical protein